jgi:transposase
LNATDRYKLIDKILDGSKTVKEVSTETGVPTSTIYRYLSRYRKSDGQLESLADKPFGSRAHPNWFTEADKDQVVSFKLYNPHLSSYQIAKGLSEKQRLKISASSVRNILSQRRVREFFSPQSLTSPPS